MAKTIDPIDRHAGSRLRLFRVSNSLRQKDVAKVLGVQWQQVQKLENGITKMTAAKIWRLCDHYGLTPVYFFEGIDRTQNGQLLEDLTPAELTEDGIKMLRIMGNLPAMKRNALLLSAEAMVE